MKHSIPFSARDAPKPNITEAEVEYENALIERLPEEQIKEKEIRMHACQERYTLSELLLESL